MAEALQCRARQPRQPVDPLNAKALITAGALMAASISAEAIDTTIARECCPHMRGTLSGTQDQMVWVLTSYIVAAAAS